MLKFIFSVFLFLSFQTISFAQDCSNMVFNGNFPIAKEQVTIICHKRYVVGYSISRKAPLWTAEVLTNDNVSAPKTARSNAFRYDTSLPSFQQPQFGDFIGTSYDRGHMVNFEDLADDIEAASESFYMTNMVVQNFQNNRGIWRALESRVRYLASSKKQIYIVTGAIFDDDKKLPLGTSIPTRLYKMILVPSTKEAYTVIVPNERVETFKLPSFITTIDTLRKTNKHVNVFPTGYQFVNKTTLK